jgi:hypothetical protein
VSLSFVANQVGAWVWAYGADYGQFTAADRARLERSRLEEKLEVDTTSPLPIVDERRTANPAARDDPLVGRPPT